MKILKKIVVGKKITVNEMNALRGGMESNTNTATPCSCSGNTQNWFWCGDNTNSQSGCICYGNDDNSNNALDCSCGI